MNSLTLENAKDLQPINAKHLMGSLSRHVIRAIARCSDAACSVQKHHTRGLLKNSQKKGTKRMTKLTAVAAVAASEGRCEIPTNIAGQSGKVAGVPAQVEGLYALTHGIMLVLLRENQNLLKTIGCIELHL